MDAVTLLEDRHFFATAKIVKARVAWPAGSYPEFIPTLRQVIGPPRIRKTNKLLWRLNYFPRTTLHEQAA